MYRFDDQDCIKFGVVGPVFIYKMVDNTAQKIQSPCSEQVLWAIGLSWTDSTNFNSNLTVYADVSRLLFGIFSLNLFYRIL